MPGAIAVDKGHQGERLPAPPPLEPEPLEQPPATPEEQPQPETQEQA